MSERAFKVVLTGEQLTQVRDALEEQLHKRKHVLKQSDFAPSKWEELEHAREYGATALHICREMAVEVDEAGEEINL